MNNQKIPTWLGTAVIIIFAITVGVLVWKVEKFQNCNKAQNQRIAQPEIVKKDQKEEQEFPEIDKEELSKLADLTKNWKTARNEQFGFEFKYPPYYSIDKPRYKDETNKIIISYGKGECAFPSGGKCRVIVGTTSTDQYHSELKYCEKYIEAKSFSINGNEINYCPGDKLGVYIKTKKGKYTIGSELYPEEIVPIVQGIYSTFKEIN